MADLKEQIAKIEAIDCRAGSLGLRVFTQRYRTSWT